MSGYYHNLLIQRCWHSPHLVSSTRIPRENNPHFLFFNWRNSYWLAEICSFWCFWYHSAFLKLNTAQILSMKTRIYSRILRGRGWDVAQGTKWPPCQHNSDLCPFKGHLCEHRAWVLLHYSFTGVDAPWLHNELLWHCWRGCFRVHVTNHAALKRVFSVGMPQSPPHRHKVVFVKMMA